MSRWLICKYLLLHTLPSSHWFQAFLVLPQYYSLSLSLYLSLMEKPHVDFGLKVLGADAMSIPGLYRFVQELIKDQVANTYLWPKTLEVQIMDPTNL
ncbi:synaptotagmin-2-like isoform X3 [Camellia sinensis]|uniref:synaptotagmin-2-like isoform X3 n=1 Tax=Camellia sinensis TaxID=4442 RepID=UPI0010366546|nr:synaptotagmin-2-like isoform X3 [Camellia sinensis]